MSGIDVNYETVPFEFEGNTYNVALFHEFPEEKSDKKFQKLSELYAGIAGSINQTGVPTTILGSRQYNSDQAAALLQHDAIVIDLRAEPHFFLDEQGKGIGLRAAVFDETGEQIHFTNSDTLNRFEESLAAHLNEQKILRINHGDMPGGDPEDMSTTSSLPGSPPGSPPVQQSHRLHFEPGSWFTISNYPLLSCSYVS